MILRTWLEQGPYTLALSSGYFGFFAHFGLLAALEQNNLVPSHISGSSAGALAGACWASGCPTATIQHALANLSKSDFWDPAVGLGLLKGQLFREFIQTLYPVSNIEECNIPLAISAYDLRTLSTHVLDSGSISDAVYASCTVPLLFHPIRIGKGLYFDGGINDRAGLAGAPKQGRILYHHLESQWPPLFCKYGRSSNGPVRPGMITVTVKDLETAGPHRLKNGRKAFQQAKCAIDKALDQRIEQQNIVV